MNSEEPKSPQITSDDIIKFIEENEAEVDEIFNEITAREERYNKYMKRWADKLMSLTPEHRADFIRKVINKYESKEYQRREWKKGHDPECLLYDVIYEYGKMYGKPCSYKENKYFAEEQYEIDSLFVASIICGQGSFISVIEVPDNEPIPHIYDTTPVQIYNPKGQLLCTTNDQTTLVDFQAQVKEKHLEGYYVIYKEKKFPIQKTGVIRFSTDRHRFTFGEEFNQALHRYIFKDKK